MKNKGIVGLIVIAGLFFTSCHEKAVTGDSQVYLHLQGGFNNSEVQILMDGNEVYNKQNITTNNLLSLADMDSTLQANGDHTIRVNINSNVSHTENFTLENTQWLGINLDPNDSSVLIIYSNERFLYD